MISMEQIRSFFPPYLREDPAHQKYLLKEYIQLMILDYLSTTPFLRKMTFIGGTNLRVVKKIDRFSEYIDFDCKDFSREDFMNMTDGIVLFLKRNGYQVEVRDKKNLKLKVFRRNIYFPKFLFELGLSGHKEERFFLKIETQDQQFSYTQKMAHIRGCGFFFPFPVPPDDILCAMKITALLSRRKGRDFYDVMFLRDQVKPDYTFLTEKVNIQDLPQLKTALLSMLSEVDLEERSRDFRHLLLNKENAQKILHFEAFIHTL